VRGRGAVADTPGLIALHRFPRPLLGPCDLKPRVAQAPGAGEATKGVRQDAMSEEGGRPRILPPPSLPPDESARPKGNPSLAYLHCRLRVT
jgi:hypothetical protein